MRLPPGIVMASPLVAAWVFPYLDRVERGLAADGWSPPPAVLEWLEEMREEGARHLAKARAASAEPASGPALRLVVGAGAGSDAGTGRYAEPTALATLALLSSRDVAHEAGVTARAVVASAGRGSLRGQRDSSGRWWFHPLDVEQYLRKRPAA